MSHRRPRVLVIAEAANPEWVSVPLVGWSLASALRQIADVHVVTQKRNRASLERAGWVHERDFTALNSEAVAAPLWKLTQRLRGGSGVAWTLVTAMSIPSYYWFEHLLWKRFAFQFREGKWDIVHRVTPLSPTSPSLLASHLAGLGVPFLVGPLNGGVPWPKEFAQARRKEKEWLSYVRDGYRLLPGYRSMRDFSAAIIIGSRATHQQLGARWAGKAVYIPENAISLPEGSGETRRRSSLPLRIIFVGRLVPYKGADMLIEACLGLVKAGQVKLEIVGDGPQRPLLERTVAEHRLSGGISFLGWLGHDAVMKRFEESHVLGFPSIREFGGGVALEAMAAGVVPVVVDYGGPAELVTPATGYLIPLGSRDSIVTALRAQFEYLSRHPDELDFKAAKAQARIERWFTWRRKAEQISQVYDWILNQGDKPDFGMPFPDT